MYNAPRHESLMALAAAQVAQLTEEQLSTTDYLALFRAEPPLDIPEEPYTTAELHGVAL